MDPLKKIAELEALLARCNPPGYVVELAPRACQGEHTDETWVWDSCDDDDYGGGFGKADDENAARLAAWEHFHRSEAMRLEEQIRKS